MKQLLYTSLAILLAISFSFSQAPQSFKYQAIVRDAEGNILPNKNINLRISIVSGQSDVILVYAETHIVQTSPFGLINIEIGNGKVESGDFSAIDWSKGNYNVNIEIDENGGTEYVSMGSSQLLSVPYALYAEQSGSESESRTKEADSWTEGTGVTYLTNPNNVGIGTTAPVSKLHVTGTGLNAIYERNISTAAGPANRFYKSRGTESSKTQIQAGDNMGQFQFWGMGDDGAYDIGATLKGVAESTRTGTDIFDVAASIQFLTTNTAYSWGERMRITADGALGLGTSNPTGELHINKPGQWAGVSFSGSGLNDLNVDHSSYNGTGQKNYIVVVTNPGPNPNLFKWSDDNGATWTENVLMATSGIDVGYGVSIGFSSVFGHTYNDQWSWTVNESYMNGLIVKNGEVGIGTDSPAGILDIAGAYHFPSVDGTSGQILKTNGSGNLSWTNAGAYSIDDLIDGKTDASSVFLGNAAGVADNGANNNAAVGIYAMYSNTSGRFNTAQGYRSMYSNNSGDYNCAFGYKSLEGNASGENNTAIGSYSLFLNTIGNNNVAIGSDAMYHNSTGSNNTACGFEALRSITTASYNIAIGGLSQWYNSTGSSNVCIGLCTNQYNIIGSQNTMVGHAAGRGLVTHSKSGNVFIGYEAGYNEMSSNKLYIENSNSDYPLIYGEFDNDLVRINGNLEVTGSWEDIEINDLDDAKTGGQSLFLGSDAGLNDDGTTNYNVGVGNNALNANTSGYRNTAAGVYALYQNTDGFSNTATGYRSLYSNTTGDYNSAFGAYSMYDNTFGYQNTACGYYSLNNNTSGKYNAATGAYSLYNNTTADYNSASGYAALYNNISGQNNSALGAKSGYNNTSGICNILLGSEANYYNQTGSYNTIVGYMAGHGTALHNKTGNVFIGYKAGYHETGNNKLIIGNDEYEELISGDFDEDYVKIYSNLGIGTNTFNDGKYILAINGTRFVPTNNCFGVYLYAHYIMGITSPELYVMDGYGNATVLSPHHFGMFEKSEPMAWSFYSENKNIGKKINVDMLKAIRLIEDVTGEKLVYLRDFDDNSPPVNESLDQEGMIIMQEQRIEKLENLIVQLQRRIEELENR